MLGRTQKDRVQAQRTMAAKLAEAHSEIKEIKETARIQTDNVSARACRADS